MSDLAAVRRTVADTRSRSCVSPGAHHAIPPSAAAEALAANYPVVGAILGHMSFADLAAEFVAEVPPTDPNLAAYGCRFPEWIVGRKLGRVLPYLSSVAAIDRSLRRQQLADQSDQ